MSEGAAKKSNGEIAKTTQEIKAQIIEALDKLPPESLEGVLEYIQFVSEPEVVDATADELEAIRRGGSLRRVTFQSASVVGLTWGVQKGTNHLNFLPGFWFS